MGSSKPASKDDVWQWCGGGEGEGLENERRVRGRMGAQVQDSLSEEVTQGRQEASGYLGRNAPDGGNSKAWDVCR